MAKPENGLMKKAGEAFEENINIQQLLTQAMQLPMVKVDRTEFLQKELRKHYSSTYVQKAIDNNPAFAGISRKKIDQIAKQVINYETNKVSAISAAAGLPGGSAAWGTIPADVVQYFGFVLRIMQKLVYLYGFPSVEINENKMDDETMNRLMVFLGIMFGADGANAGVKALAEIAAKQIQKQLPKKALTKGTIYPIVQKIAKELGIKMTKQIFAEAISKTGVPIASAAVSGTITYVTFKSSANKLMESLRKLNLSDPEFYKHGETM